MPHGKNSKWNSLLRSLWPVHVTGFRAASCLLIRSANHGLVPNFNLVRSSLRNTFVQRLNKTQREGLCLPGSGSFRDEMLLCELEQGWHLWNCLCYVFFCCDCSFVPWNLRRSQVLCNWIGLFPPFRALVQLLVESFAWPTWPTQQHLLHWRWLLVFLSLIFYFLLEIDNHSKLKSILKYAEIQSQPSPSPLFPESLHTGTNPHLMLFIVVLPEILCV